MSDIRAGLRVEPLDDKIRRLLDGGDTLAVLLRERWSDEDLDLRAVALYGMGFDLVAVADGPHAQEATVLVQWPLIQLPEHYRFPIQFVSAA